MILKKNNLPILLVVGFNLMTLVIFLTAPIVWFTDNEFYFIFLALISQFFVYLGFGLTFLIKYAYILKFQPYEIPKMISFLGVGFLDPQLGYELSLSNNRSETIPWVVYFFISIVNQVFFIYGFLAWKKLNKLTKLLFVIFLIIEVFFWLGRGTNFGVIVLLLSIILSKLFSNENDQKLKKNKTIRFIFTTVFLCVIGLYFFSNNMSRRSGNADLDFKNFDIGNSPIDINHYSLKIIPVGLQQTYLYVVSYISQGYYHTCLAFDIEYQPTFFTTSTPALISFGEIFGINNYENTYVYRLKYKGVDPEINWHSSYTWYASDFTFFGVPFLFLFMGYILGYSWDLGIRNQDLLSKIVFVIFANSLIFVFANNNYLSSVFYSLLFIFPIWYFSRTKRI